MPATARTCGVSPPRRRAGARVPCWRRRPGPRRPGRRRPRTARRRDRQHPRLLPRLQLRREQPRADAQRRRQLVRDGQRRPPDDHQVRVAAAHATAAGRLPLRLSGTLRARSPAPAPARGCGRRPRCSPPLQAWQALGQPTIAINANFFDVRGQTGWLLEVDGMQFAARRLLRQHPRPGPRQHRRDGHPRLRGQAGLSGGDENLDGADDDDPAGRRRTICRASEAHPTTTTPPRPSIQDLLDKGTRFVAVAGIGLLAPGDTGQLNDGGPSAARTALALRPRARTRCTSSRAAATHPTRSRTCSAGWAATPPAARRRRIVGHRATAGHRRHVGGRRRTEGVLRHPCRCCATPASARCPSWLAFN